MPEKIRASFWGPFKGIWDNTPLFPVHVLYHSSKSLNYYLEWFPFMDAVCGNDLLGLALFVSVTASAVTLGLSLIYENSKKKKHEVLPRNSWR